MQISSIKKLEEKYERWTLKTFEILDSKNHLTNNLRNDKE